MNHSKRPVKNSLREGSVVATAELGGKPKFFDTSIVSDPQEAVDFITNILESSTEYSVIAKDLEGKILLWNEGARRLYGYEPDEVVGKANSSILHVAEDVAAGKPRQIMEAALQQGKWEGTLARRRKNGEQFTARLLITPRRDAGGKPVGFLVVSKDITNEIRMAQYARSLIEAALDPLVTISPEGKITDVNEATVKATGVLREELVGTDFSNYFTEPGKAREGYRQAFAKGALTDYPLTIRHVDGRLMDVLYNASVYRDENDKVLGVFAAARDITERKRAEEEIKKLNARLENRVAERTADLVAVIQELESFNYSVSHDLRAPLRHIDGFSKILLEEHGARLPDDGRRCVDRIGEGARRMGRMVDELLELSRTSRSELSRQLTGLRSLVDDVREELMPEMHDREIEWHISDLPFADCDPALTRQVFANLIANAIKFTRHRKPAVIEVGQTVSRGQAAFFVRDNGVGFSMKYADKLFGVFQRLHRQEDFEGTGVGLATVQRIIQKHGGRIWAEAELEKGATFYFTLEPPARSFLKPLNTEATTVFAGERDDAQRSS